MTEFLRLTWDDFDIAVDIMADRAAAHKLECVYGPPRGGLVLATALSHRLNIPLMLRPDDFALRTLWVDDIYETGKTYEKTTNLCVAAAYTWAIKTDQPTRKFPVKHVRMIEPGVWIIFPWEDSMRAASDRAAYYKEA